MGFFNKIIKNKSDKNNDERIVDIYSPLTGKIKDLENVNDPIFSKKIMGSGLAIEPYEAIDELTSPFERAKITSAYATNHAFEFSINNGPSFLLYIGIDSIELKGKGITSYFKKDDIIRKNDVLAKVNFAFFKEKKLPGIDVILLLIDDKISNYEIFDKVNQGSEIKQGDILFKVKFK